MYHKSNYSTRSFLKFCFSSVHAVVTVAGCNNSLPVLSARDYVPCSEVQHEELELQPRGCMPQCTSQGAVGPDLYNKPM